MSVKCHHCGIDFEPFRSTHIFCSKKCADANWKSKNKDRLYLIGVLYRDNPSVKHKRRTSKNTPEYRDYNKKYLRQYYRDKLKGSDKEKERVRAKRKRDVDELRGHYIKDKLRRMGINNPTKEEINVKRKLIKLKRVIYEKQSKLKHVA